MPAVLAKGAVILLSVAVAAAIAVYESPQARQLAEDIRRRVGIALHALGEEINPASRPPRFNRPEDAEGFMRSTREACVEADDDSKRRQREELMYWNALHLEKKEKEQQKEPHKRTTSSASPSRGLSFDDLLKEDTRAEKGTYIYNSGRDVEKGINQGLTYRGAECSMLFANPVAEEHHIERSERKVDTAIISPQASEKIEDTSDVPNVAKYTQPIPKTTATLPEQLIDTSDTTAPDPPVSYPTMDDLVQKDKRCTSMRRASESFASIHAWSDHPTPNRPYAHVSPPPTPQSQELQQFPVPMEDFDDPPISLPSSGEATLTDTMSLAGSAEEISYPQSDMTSEADMMSGDGISTPGSWTEVGSEVSEHDVGTTLHS